MSGVEAILDRDVFQFQLGAVAEEMSAAIRRSAFSPIIWDMLDYSCAVFSAQGEMLAQAETIPAQLGVMGYALEGVTRELPLETWRPGDVIICNDPYRGCTHTPDIVLFSPVFAQDRLIAVTATIAHHVDIGGKLPSTTAPDNLEVFAEGLLFPPMKLLDGGVRNETIFRFIEGNVRNPRACIGDLSAQVAGCRTGERRVLELADRYGVARFAELAAECLDYGERYLRNALAAIPRREYRSEVLIEDDVSARDPLRIVASVRVDEDSITVDFAGSDAQRANALNCPLSSTCSMALYAVRALVASDGPRNEGGNRAVRILVPEGSFLNPLRPAAVGNRHFAQQAVADAVLKALVDAMPERSAAGCQISFPALRAGGFDTRQSAGGARRYFILHDIIGGGMGGSSNADGLDAVDTHGGNCGVLSAEIVESLGPVRVLRSELVQGSGGTGRHRGGLAMRRDYEMLADDLIVSVFLQQAGAATAPWGAQGGGAGAPAGAVMNPGRTGEFALSTKAIGLKPRKGDVIRVQSAGGGGWGAAADRDRGLVDRDIRESYV